MPFDLERDAERDDEHARLLEATIADIEVSDAELKDRLRQQPARHRSALQSVLDDEPDEK